MFCMQWVSVSRLSAEHRAETKEIPHQNPDDGICLWPGSECIRASNELCDGIDPVWRTNVNR